MIIDPHTLWDAWIRAWSRWSTPKPDRQRGCLFEFHGYSGETFVHNDGSRATLDVDGKKITIQRDPSVELPHFDYHWIGEPDPLALAKLRLLI